MPTVRFSLSAVPSELVTLTQKEWVPRKGGVAICAVVAPASGVEVSPAAPSYH